MTDAELQIIEFLMTSDATRPADLPDLLALLEGDRQEELSHELITVASLMYVRRLHPGISFDTARALIAEHAADPARLQDLSGRIMAFRLSCCFERLKRVGLPGAGRRPSCLLLRQRGPVQGSAERRDPAVRLLLGATHRPAPLRS